MARKTDNHFSDAIYLLFKRKGDPKMENQIEQPVQNNIADEMDLALDQQPPTRKRSKTKYYAVLGEVIEADSAAKLRRQIADRELGEFTALLKGKRLTPKIKTRVTF